MHGRALQGIHSFPFRGKVLLLMVVTCLGGMVSLQPHMAITLEIPSVTNPSHAEDVTPARRRLPCLSCLSCLYARAERMAALADQVSTRRRKLLARSLTNPIATFDQFSKA